MANKTLKSETTAQTPELDFNFDDEFSSDLNQEASVSSSRKVVTDVIRGAGSEIKRSLLSPNTYKDILRQTLPREYGDISDGASEVTTGLKDLYNQTFRELNPKLNSITKSLDRFVPESQKTLKKLIKKIDLATGGRDFGTYGEVSKEEQTNQAVTNLLGDVFQAQRAEGKIADAKQMVRDKIEGDRFNRSYAATDSMSRDISTLAQYTTKITQAYQRKDLEISARTYLANQEFHAKVLDVLETHRAQQEAIVKNTALPDFVKITKSEQFMERSRERMIDSLYGEGSPIKKGMDKIKRAAGDFVSGLSGSLSTIDMAMEGVASQKEALEEMNRSSIEAGMGPLFTKAELAGNAMGAGAAGWLKNKAIDKIKPYVDKNEELKERVASFSKYATNPGAQLAKYRETDEWQEKLNADGPSGKFYKMLDFLMEQFQDDGPNRSFSTGNGLSGLDDPTAGFSKRAALSLTTVIPGHLAHIHREIKMLRTGERNVPLMTYDFKMGDFTTKASMQSRIMGDLKKEAARSTYSYGTSKTAEKLITDSGMTVNEETKLGLRIFLSRLAREDDVMLDDLEAIQGTDAYQSMTPDVQEVIDIYFKNLTDGGEFHRKTAAFTKDVRGIRAGMPSLDKHMKDYIDAGHGDLLEKEGLMKKSADGGSYDVDEERFYQFLESNIDTYASDINVKKDIRRTSPLAVLSRTDRKLINFGKKFPGAKEAYEGMRKTKLFNYRYKDKMGDARPHDGPMAQDVQQHLGNDVAPNGKAIDVQSLSASFFGAVQYLGDKYDQLFKKKEEKKAPVMGEPTVLEKIEKNTAETNRILSKKGVILGGVVVTGMRAGKPMGVMDAPSQALSQSYRNIKDVAIDPAMAGAKRAGGFLSDFYRENKDPFMERVSQGAAWAKDRLKNAFEYGQGVVNKIPGYIAQGKDRAKDLANSARDKFKELRDLYLPDGTEPVIRAAKVKLGFYLDEETGEPLTTMEQILRCKNNIVDKSGNIIASAEEMATGFRDRHGQEIKGFGTRLLEGAVGIGSYMFGKASSLFKGLKTGAIKGLSDIKKFFKENSLFKGGLGMGSFELLKKIHEETVNIRDVMLGDKEDVMRRLKKKIKSVVSDILSPSAGGESSSDEATSGQVGGGAAPDSFGLLGRGARTIGNLFGRAKDKLLGKPATTGTATGAEGPANRRARRAMRGDKAAALRNKPAKAPGFFGRMKGKLPPKLLSGMGKAGGMMKRGFGRVGRIASGALSLLGMGGDQAQAGEGVDKSDGQEEHQSEAQRDDYSSLDKSTRKNTVAAADRAWNDKDGNGDRDGGVAEREERIKALKESRTRETQKADLTAKYLGPPMAGGIMGMSMSFLSGIGDKITALFDLTTGLFKKLPGMSKILGGAKGLLGRGAGVLGNMAKGVGRVFGGTALRTGGSFVARHLGMQALRSAAVVGFQALAMSSAGAAVVAAAPAILVTAAIAGTAYGLYRLYKYTRRDDATKYDQLRLRQYGFAYRDNVYRFNHYAFQLEDYLQDEKVGYDEMTGKAYLIDKKIKTEELLETMSIDPKDTEAVSNFTSWFKSRFRPVFLAHMTGLYKQDPKLKLKEVIKLKPSQKLAYLEAARLKDTDVYNFDVSPVKELEYLDVNTEDIETSFKNLIDKEKELESKESKKAPLPEKVVENKTQAATDLEKNAAEKAALALGIAKAKTPTNGSADPGNKTPTITPEARAQLDASYQGEGDGTAGNLTKMQNLPTSGRNSIDAKPIPVAGGAIIDGQKGLSYIQRQKNVDIENLNPTMLRMFLGMAEEYGQLTGKKINVNSGKRSYADQERLYKDDPTKASRPGGSLHEIGLAVDINSVDANELERLGLMKKYGFTRPVGQEPWHLEPAGIQKAIAQAKKNPSLASSMIEAGIGRGGGGYGTDKGAAKSRRNNDLALALLDAKGQDVKDTAPGSEPITPITRPAANDPSYSKSQQLPASTEGARSRVEARESAPDPYDNSPQASTPSAPLSTDKESMKKVITESAKRVGVDPNIALTFAAVESNLNPNARAGSSNGTHSSAAGLMQFLDGTWRESMAKYGAKYGIDPSTPQTDPRAAALLGSELIKDNMKAISGVRPNPNATDAYFAHFLGAAGTRQFFSQDQNQPAAATMKEAAASNRPIFYDKSGRARTHAEIYKLMEAKLQKKAKEVGVSLQSSSAGGDVSTGSFAANDAVAPTPAKASPANSSGFTPQPISSSGKPSGIQASGGYQDSLAQATPKPPFSFDMRFPGKMPTVQQDATAPTASTALNSMEGLMTKSVDIQEKSYQALQQLVQLLNPEKFGAVVAQATAAAIPKPEAAKPDVKQQDQANMGRTTQVASSSLDLRRRSA